jgi:hypothetical protein
LSGADYNTLGVAIQAVDEVDRTQLRVFALRRPGSSQQVFARAGEHFLFRLHGYAGAVAAASDAVAVTFPRGDRLVRWHAT